MKIQETITTKQRTNLLLNKIPCGIFEKLFNEDEGMYSLRTPLSVEYYLNRSGHKECGVIFDHIFEWANEYEPFPQSIILVDELPTKNIDQYALYVIDGTVEGFLTSDNETFLTKAYNLFYVAVPNGQIYYYRYVNDMWVRYEGSTELVPKLTNEQKYSLVNETIALEILRPKYLDKWNRIYKALVQEQYNALYDEEYERTKTVTSQNKTTYDTEVENDGNVGTHETRTFSGDTTNDVYGFNSIAPVGDSTSENTTEETTVGDASRNTSHNTQTKSGTDTKDNTHNETETNRGRNRSGAELLKEELDFRNAQTMMSIILKDIDEEITLKIYL